jgi:hypothetical protein
MSYIERKYKGRLLSCDGEVLLRCDDKAAYRAVLLVELADFTLRNTSESEFRAALLTAVMSEVDKLYIGVSRLRRRYFKGEAGRR